MRHIQNPSRNYFYQPRPELMTSLSKFIAVVEYNLIDSGFFDLHKNMEDMILAEEAERIIDFIGNNSGIEDIYLLIDELQLETDVELSPQTVLFVMIAPLVHIEEQLNVDEETARWLFNKLHINFLADDLLGFVKELLLEAENQKSNQGRMLS
jgi:hypothetical protein